MLKVILAFGICAVKAGWGLTVTRFVWQARPPYICLLCSFCSSDREFATGLLHTPPHDGHTCLSLTVPTAKPVVDFHHRVTAHSGQTIKNSYPNI